MSNDLGFRKITRHRGPYRAFLDRYEIAAAAARAAGGAGYATFCSSLPTFVSDERNLKCAIDYLDRYGGTAPGPDGMVLASLCMIERWELARELRDRLRRGVYVPAPPRLCPIPKRLGSPEKRTIWVGNLEDRVVAGGAAQILVPLVDCVIDPMTYSWRERGTQAALAYAARAVLDQDCTVWITEDLRNAFDHVPRARLNDVLRLHVPDDEFCRLVIQLAARPSPRGIMQGSPLSPPLLDLYLGHFLHRRWQRGGGRPPLLTYVDDLWIGCRPNENAFALYRELEACIRDAGMRAKLGAAASIADLRDRSVTWLGYRLRLLGDELRIRSAFFAPTSVEKLHQKHQLLVAKFARLYERPAGWCRPNSLVRGIVNYLAPTLPFEDRPKIYERIANAAAEAGFDEIWSFDHVLEYWTAAHDRWLARLNGSTCD
jgi:hypothetical protein